MLTGVFWQKIAILSPFSKVMFLFFVSSFKAVASVLGIAPVFHITGLMTNVGMVWATGCSVVLPYRFHPVLIAHLVEKYKCTFTTAAITAFTALLNDKQCSLYNFSSFSKVYSGGGFFPFFDLFMHHLTFFRKPPSLSPFYRLSRRSLEFSFTLHTDLLVNFKKNSRSVFTEKE